MALTITRIPDRYRHGLAKIVALPPESVSVIADALGQTPVNSLKDMTAAVERVANLSAEDAEAIITSLRSLYVFKAGVDASVEEVIPVIIAAMQGSGYAALSVSDADKAIVATKFKSLLSLRALERSSKIEQLKTDHQAIFYDAKILTDLRPVFDQPREQPIGSIIIHTLKVIFHESGEQKELYFALDAEDILTLKKIAERAADKMYSLQAVLKSANIPDLT